MAAAEPYLLPVSVSAAETDSELYIRPAFTNLNHPSFAILSTFTSLSVSLSAFLKVFHMFYLCDRPTSVTQHNVTRAQTRAHTLLDLYLAGVSSWEPDVSGISNRKKQMTWTQKQRKLLQHLIRRQMKCGLNDRIYVSTQSRSHLHNFSVSFLRTQACV